MNIDRASAVLDATARALAYLEREHGITTILSLSHQPYRGDVMHVLLQREDWILVAGTHPEVRIQVKANSDGRPTVFAELGSGLVCIVTNGPVEDFPADLLERAA